MTTAPRRAQQSLPPVRRFRDWVFASIVLSLTITLAVVWGVWVTTRVGTYPRGVQQGGTWVDPYSGMEFAVIGWQTSRWLPDADRVVVAPEGMVYVSVVARWKGRGDEGGCTLELVGRGQETWDETESSDDLPYSCLQRDRELGSGVVYHNFVVPESKLPEVRGLIHPQSMRFDQGPVLRPPA
ncbi:hypothetical protein ACSDQ9_13760 [Aestuariimicrobium soli]|uniref:hypothetical protein n=1 Tax=Aestuariimicrobium soli TaxID=2035834 RepID=UPI003EC0364E